MMNRSTKIKGITLIEILIGVVISSIMMGAMFTSYKVVNGSYSQIIDKANISNKGRGFVNMLTRDIRMAGFKYFEDPLLTINTDGEPDIPIEITKSQNDKCCDSIIIIFGDYDNKKTGNERFQRYRVDYAFRTSTSDSSVFQITKRKQRWNNKGKRYEVTESDPATYNAEVVADYITDIEFIATDKLGNEINPPPSWSENKMGAFEIHNIEMFITFRSKKDFYKKKKTRTVYSIFDKLRNQQNNDKFMRESLTVTTYARNMDNYR